MADGGDASSGGGKASALIVAGAAGRGPYAAGALSQLARDARFDIRHLAGASSGALNAAVYAAGLRVGAAPEAADHLCDLWRGRAHWNHIVTHEQRVDIVRKALERFRDRRPVHKVELEIVATSLRGQNDKYGYLRFEKPWQFSSGDFSNDGGISEIAEKSVLSSTIPGVFPPASYGDEGQFWDGGVVNNTPIGNALRKDPSIDHIIVVTNDSTRADPADKEYGRLALPRLLEMVIEERLSRDLHDARSFNDELKELRRAGFDLGKIQATVKWKLLQFLEIRPSRDVEGDLVSGFFSAQERAHSIEIGQQTALERLRAWQPEDFAAQV
jgi:predicted acylesterase/phospholipase RssA